MRCRDAGVQIFLAAAGPGRRHFADDSGGSGGSDALQVERLPISPEGVQFGGFRALEAVGVRPDALALISVWVAGYRVVRRRLPETKTGFGRVAHLKEPNPAATPGIPVVRNGHPPAHCTSRRPSRTPESFGSA